MPFDIKVEAVLSKLKMEIINFQCDTGLRNAVWLVSQHLC